MAYEIHQRLDAREHRRQRLGERCRDRDAQRGFPGRHLDRDPAGMLLAVDRNAHRAAIAAAVHRFDAGDRTYAEECAHRRPIERRPETQLELEHIGCGGYWRTASERAAQLPGFEAVALLEERVEAPNAAETARECHLGDRQRSV